MRNFLITMSLLALPAIAFAQAQNDSPLISVTKLGNTATAPAEPVKPAAAAPAPAPAATAAPTPSTVVISAPAATAAPAPADPKMNAAEQILNTFPDWAVSKAGSDTTDQASTPPADAATPTPPAPPANAPAAPTPDVPKPPAAPDKLWPKDTVTIFLRSCTGFHAELVTPCSCVITHLMVAMPHDEFMRLSAANAVNSDQRVINIRQQCLGTPGKRGQ